MVDLGLFGPLLRACPAFCEPLAACASIVSDWLVSYAAGSFPDWTGEALRTLALLVFASCEARVLSFCRLADRENARALV